jgi:myo-inositol-1-phosphate synthase
MTRYKENTYHAQLLMIAGAKGAIGSTLATAASVMGKNPESILPWLTTKDAFSAIDMLQNVHVAGWDSQDAPLMEAVNHHGVLPNPLWQPLASDLENIPIRKPPSAAADLKTQVAQISSDMTEFKTLYPHALPIFISLLPATVQQDLTRYDNISDLYHLEDSSLLSDFPDLAYATAAVTTGIPVVNFTPNTIEIPAVLREAEKQGLPMAGRDGKTGQTYLKTVLASALKARSLYIDGWYSTNILGNSDGKNLMDPEKAASKVTNKTDMLDDMLGYSVGERYETPTHKVRIDYYPPRGDAKEAWDVIDFQGLFGLPMSIRLNLQARDSILAAPMVLDLSRWMAVLQITGHTGPVPELGFYFKKPVGHNPPLTFQDQVQALKMLERDCMERLSKG